jgi:phosphate:Na+ symporter
MEEEINLWEFFAGIGIFLFGMFLLEESIKKLSGRSFKVLIRKYTSNNFKGILTGTLSTAVLQSSSTVSLMVIAFAGAGIMTFENAIGVILGSNLGTTFTTWIVASVGFKMKIELLALPFIAVGGFGTIFTGKSEKWSSISKLLVGFGFIFLGLDYMKTSVEVISQTFDFNILRGKSILIFVALGFGLTALVQSSSATTAITLTALQNGMISFEEATAIVIGTNMGTTITIIIATIGKDSIQKRIASSHFIFNFATGILALVFLKPLNHLVINFFALENEPILALALFHTVFNLLGIIVFYPFINALSKFLNEKIKDKVIVVTKFISQSTVNVSEAAIEALKKETIRLFLVSMFHNLEVFGIKTKKLESIKNIKQELRENNLKTEKKELYWLLKDIQKECFVFATTIQSLQLNETESQDLHQLMHAIKYITASSKTSKDLEKDFEELSNSESELIQNILIDFNENILEFYEQLEFIFNNEDDENQQLADLISLLNKVFEQEKSIVENISSNIKENKINQNQVNPMLTINRGITLSHRQLLIGLKEIVLDDDKVAIFDKMINN